MTATRTTLLALASRVEAATSGCRKLDAEICSRLFGRSIGVSRYTFNIDAALSLVPSGAWFVVKNVMGPQPISRDLFVADVLHPNGKDRPIKLTCPCATPALALTAACLRARAIAGSLTDD